jgi:hypothetical protein
MKKNVMLTPLVLFLMGGSMNAEAGLFGSDDFSWKEEVMLHDGRKTHRQALAKLRRASGAGAGSSDQRACLDVPVARIGQVGQMGE